jgi:hypothetical protein
MSIVCWWGVSLSADADVVRGASDGDGDGDGEIGERDGWIRAVDEGLSRILRLFCRIIWFLSVARL